MSKNKTIEKFIRNILRENLLGLDKDIFRFNDGSINKNGTNILYKNNKPIVTFGIGKIGPITINNMEYNNSLYLMGGYSASKQNMGYGTLGIKILFEKLPKIENIILQCYDTACPFWEKIGGLEIDNKEMGGGHLLRTLIINRNNFKSS